MNPISIYDFYLIHFIVWLVSFSINEEIIHISDFYYYK